jgi:hypothetical protein
MVSFLIIPNMNYEPSGRGADVVDGASNTEEKVAFGTDAGKIIHLRALYNYVPHEDMFIPCKEIGLPFAKGDILHILSQDDEDWWQAYRDDDRDQSLAGLIPAQLFQERRFAQMQALIGDSFMDRKKRDKGFCIRGLHKKQHAGATSRRRRYMDAFNRTFQSTFTYFRIFRDGKRNVARFDSSCCDCKSRLDLKQL